MFNTNERKMFGLYRQKEKKQTGDLKYSATLDKIDSYRILLKMQNNITI